MIVYGTLLVFLIFVDVQVIGTLMQNRLRTLQQSEDFMMSLMKTITVMMTIKSAFIPFRL